MIHTYSRQGEASESKAEESQKKGIFNFDIEHTEKVCSRGSISSSRQNEGFLRPDETCTSICRWRAGSGLLNILESVEGRYALLEVPTSQQSRTMLNLCTAQTADSCNERTLEVSTKPSATIRSTFKLAVRRPFGLLGPQRFCAWQNPLPNCNDPWRHGPRKVCISTFWLVQEQVSSWIQPTTRTYCWVHMSREAYSFHCCSSKFTERCKLVHWNNCSCVASPRNAVPCWFTSDDHQRASW